MWIKIVCAVALIDAHIGLAKRFIVGDDLSWRGLHSNYEFPKDDSRRSDSIHDGLEPCWNDKSHN